MKALKRSLPSEKQTMDSMKTSNRETLRYAPW